MAVPAIAHREVRGVRPPGEDIDELRARHDDDQFEKAMADQVVEWFGS